MKNLERDDDYKERLCFQTEQAYVDYLLKLKYLDKCDDVVALKPKIGRKKEEEI